MSGAVAPPPLPAATQWFVAINGQQQGPLAAAAMSGLVAQGQMTSASLVWSAGMPGWQPAAQVPRASGLVCGNTSTTATDAAAIGGAGNGWYFVA